MEIQDRLLTINSYSRSGEKQNKIEVLQKLSEKSNKIIITTYQ